MNTHVPQVCTFVVGHTLKVAQGLPLQWLSVCLCRGESVRTAFMLAQGGEFAFVLLSLAAELKVLPEELNKLLIIVVVISMALTPGLASIGKKLADKYDEEDEQSGKACLLAWHV